MPLVRLGAARHIGIAMNTATAKPPLPMRIHDIASVVPSTQFLHWIAHAGRTPGLTRPQSAFLLFMAAHLADSRTGSVTMSIEAIAAGIDMDPRTVARAVDGLINEHCLIGITPGRGGAASEFCMALPKRLMPARHAAAAGDAPPF